MALLVNAPGNGYQWGGSTWTTDPARKGICEVYPPGSKGGCPNCRYPDGDSQTAGDHSKTGSDCAGLVLKAWQTSGPQSIEEPVQMRVLAKEFQKDRAGYWEGIDMGDLARGDAVANDGHVMIFDGYSGKEHVWYEASGCASGIVNGVRKSYDAKWWGAVRRTKLLASRLCTPDICSGHGECDEDNRLHPTEQGNPTRREGTCVCEPGYTGPNCERCVRGYYGYPVCHKPTSLCIPQGELKCNQDVKVTPDPNLWKLSAYSCGAPNSSGLGLVYKFLPKTRGHALVTVQGGGSVGILRNDCTVDACVAGGPSSADFYYGPYYPLYLAVEGNGATGDLTLRLECETAGGPWIGDNCTADADCLMTKPDKTKIQGYCYKPTGAAHGFCSLECTNKGCPDLLSSKATTACIDSPSDPNLGMCVSKSVELNNFCASVPGSASRTLPLHNAPKRTETVCAPPPGGVLACTSSVTGRVLAAGTNSPIEGAIVSLTGGVSGLNIGTDAKGRYSLVNVPCNTYGVEVSANGYQNERASATVTNTTATQISDITMVANGACAATASLSGRVVDGSTETTKAMPGATVKLRRGGDTLTGDVVGLASTGADGSYSVGGLAPGLYTASVLVGEELASTWQNQLACTANSDAGTVTVVPPKSNALMRIALRWVRPPDLDFHVLLPNGNEVYFRDECLGAETIPPYMTLDIDRETAVGPEVISLYRYMPGTYTVFVHNFSQQVRTEFFGDDDPAIHDVSFEQSAPSITVYGQNGAEIAHYVPPEGNGYFWDVFTIDGATGAIAPVQRISDGHKNPDVEYATDHCGPLP